MKVQELFESINGEFPFMGTPTTILRLAGCNLTCDYCDAPANDGTEMTITEILTQVVELGQRRILITGGEPLLQRTELLALSARLAEASFEVLYETNGTQDISAFIPFGTVSVDVKLFDVSSFRLSNLQYMGLEDCLKFVYRDKYEFMSAIGFIELNIVQGQELGHAPYMIVFSPVNHKEHFLPELLTYAKSRPMLDIRIQTQVHKQLEVG